MSRRSNNFDELGSFKSTMKREKDRSLPSFEGVSVLLEDAESGVEFSIPVAHVKSVFPVHANKPTVKVRLVTGETYFVNGSVAEVLGKISTAKIKGGHN